jgi:adenosylcobinamide kinase/adenosylcobinamide-phosphate guanylyltransferase
MANVIYISGGQRSGKSSFAQAKALELSQSPIYLATARILDKEIETRINRHKSDRDERWETIEENVKIHEVTFPENSVVVVDCITLWLTNIFFDNDENAEKSEQIAKDIWTKFLQKNISIIVVSNEIGMGLHADTETGRNFTDLQGRVNQFIAKDAKENYFMISGIPLKVK